MNILIILCIFSKSGATAAETPRKDGVEKTESRKTELRKDAERKKRCLSFFLFLFPYVPFLNSNSINFILIIISITIIITIIGFFGFCTKANKPNGFFRFF